MLELTLPGEELKINVIRVRQNVRGGLKSLSVNSGKNHAIFTHTISAKTNSL